MVRLSALWMACVVASTCATPALAQLQLPGAAAPTPAGATPAPASGGKPRKPGSGTGASSGPDGPGAAVITRAPGEDTVVGRQFQRNGSTGVMALDRAPGKSLEMTKLVLVGYQISKPAELCRVEVSGGSISLKPDRRYEGLVSYQVEMEACPFSVDVLDGAIRARGKTCEFKAADCNADPGGVWGPPGAGISEAESKEIEKVRAKGEKDARAAFRALLARASGDKARTTEIAREQASFSSVREESCRDYAREDKHGFCASRITIARAVALSAQLDPASYGGTADAAVKPPPKRKPKPKPKPATASAPMVPLPSPQ